VSNQTVTAIYTDAKRATRAMGELMDAGFDRSDISLLMSKETRVRYYPESNTGEAAGVGAAVGGLLGGLVAIATMPPVGIVAAGPLLALLGGAAVGAAGGGMFGALVELGIPEDTARWYEERIAAGDILVGVACEDAARAAKARKILAEEVPASRPVTTRVHA